MPSPQPTNPRGTSGPTAKQLRLLRSLAHNSGQTFAYPRTKRQASAEIRRLLDVIGDTPIEQLLEQRVEAERLSEVHPPANAAAIRDDEIDGYGAHAHWFHGRDRSGS
jgi:hypothetical protein